MSPILKSFADVSRHSQTRKRRWVHFSLIISSRESHERVFFVASSRLSNDGSFARAVAVALLVLFEGDSYRHLQ